MNKTLAKDGSPVRQAEAPPPAGTTSRNITGFRALEKFTHNPETITLKTFDRMRKTDPTISAALEFIKLATVSRLGPYVHPDEEIQDFVRLNFEQMRGSLNQTVSEILSALWAGFSVTEIAWRTSEMQEEDSREMTGSIMIESLPTLKPYSVSFHIVTDGGPQHGEPDIVYQWPNSSDEIALEVQKKTIIYSHRKEFGNVYGTSRLKAAYKPWWMYDVVLKAYCRAMERYGSPLIVGTVPNADAPVMKSGVKSTQGAEFLKILSDIHDNAAMVKSPEYLVELLETGKNIGSDFKECLEFLNRMKLRAVLIPSLIFDNTDVGSYALGQTHFDVLTLALDHILGEVSEVILEDLVKWVIFFNFGNQETWGEFQNVEAKPEDLKMWAEVVEKLTGINVIDMGDLEDLNKARDKFGFDPLEQAREEENFESEEDIQFREELRAELINSLRSA